MQIRNFTLPTIWTQIKGHTNYQISICGQVKNIRTNKILNAWKNGHGYYYVDLSNKSLKIHRLVAEHYLPNINKKSEIDHIDNQKHNNTISNLRWCDQEENNHNQSLRKDNKSGKKGVIFYERNQKWGAYITYKKKRIHLGLFENLEDAINACELFGDFFNACEK